MACTKISLLFVCLFGLAFFVGNNEARPDPGKHRSDTKNNGDDNVDDGGANATADDNGDGGVDGNADEAADNVEKTVNELPNDKVADLLPKLGDGLLGNLVDALPAEDRGAGVRALGQEGLTGALQGVPRPDVNRLIQNAPEGVITSAFKNVGEDKRQEFLRDDAKKFPNIPENELKKDEQDLDISQIVTLALALQNAQLGNFTGDLDPAELGKLFKNLSPEQRTAVIATQPKGNLVNLANQLPDGQLNQLLGNRDNGDGGDGGVPLLKDAAPAPLGGSANLENALDTFTNEDLVKIVKNDLTPSEVGGFVKKVDTGNSGKFVEGLPIDTLKAIISKLTPEEKENALAQISTSDIKANLANLPPDELQADLPDGAGDLQGLPETKLRQTLANLPDDELAKLVLTNLNTNQKGQLFQGFTDPELGNVFKGLDDKTFATDLNNVDKGAIAKAVRGFSTARLAQLVAALPADIRAKLNGLPGVDAAGDVAGDAAGAANDAAGAANDAVGAANDAAGAANDAAGAANDAAGAANDAAGDVAGALKGAGVGKVGGISL